MGHESVVQADEVYVAFLFDVHEKHTMHATPSACFLSGEVDDGDGAAYEGFVCQKSYVYELRVSRALMRCRRAVASKMKEDGPENLFVTEKMNTRDFS